MIVSKFTLVLSFSFLSFDLALNYSTSQYYIWCTLHCSSANFARILRFQRGKSLHGIVRFFRRFVSKFKKRSRSIFLPLTFHPLLPSNLLASLDRLDYPPISFQHQTTRTSFTMTESSPSPLKGVRCLLFDTFGTLTDWDTSISRALKTKARNNAKAKSGGPAGSLGIRSE